MATKPKDAAPKVAEPIALPGKKRDESVDEYFLRRLKQAEPGKRLVADRQQIILQVHDLLENISSSQIGPRFSEIQMKTRRLMEDLELIRSAGGKNDGDFSRVFDREAQSTLDRDLGEADFERAVREASNR